MSVRIRSRHADLGGGSTTRFNEDAPRPPVPGMEGDTTTTTTTTTATTNVPSPSPLSKYNRSMYSPHSFYPTKTNGNSVTGVSNGDSFRGGGGGGGLSDGSLSVSVAATPRRSDLDLGYEPEGSASPTPPYLRWAESLHSLLDDEDGIQLFRAFLCQEDCGDLLDFWFACSGFRKLPGGTAVGGSLSGSGTGSTSSAAGSSVSGTTGSSSSTDSGVRSSSSDGGSGKRLKLAKAIYRKYIADGSGSVTARQIKPATRSFIRDCVSRQQLDASLFEQAQTEVQGWMEENTYPLFLKSDVYLKHAREHGSWGVGGSGSDSGGGNDGPVHGSADCNSSNPLLNCGSSGGGVEDRTSEVISGGKGVTSVAAGLMAQLTSSNALSSSMMTGTTGGVPAVPPLLPGYLPTLMEDKEWERSTEREEEEEVESGIGGSAPASRLTRELLMETAPLRSSGRKLHHDVREFRHVPWKEPVNPYYVNTGYARAPATSANDSEQQSMSSDADTMSLTDSSVDGIPPYRYRKHHRKEMQESAKVNGRVPLPHIPRTHRLPKDVHVEPERFAAELIVRLESVQREREAQERLEERLRRVRLEEEGDDADVSVVTSVPPYGGGVGNSGVVAMGAPGGASEDDPERILDEHVSRVMKTPGCHSPRSPPSHPHLHPHPHHHHHHPPLSAYHTHPAHTTATHKHPYHTHPHTHTHAAHLGVPGEHADAGGWNGEAALHHHYASSRGRSYGDGVGAAHQELMGYGSKGSTLSRRGLKPKGEAAKGDDGRGPDGRGVESGVPAEELDHKQKILQWMMEGDRESSRHKKSSYSGSGSFKRSQALDPSSSSSSSRPSAGSLDRAGGLGMVPMGMLGGGGTGAPMSHGWASGGGGGGGVSGGAGGGVQPSHLFIQDPTMPPNPAPNPLTQLEEARRRLEEERRRTAALQAKQRHKTAKRAPCDNVTVAYYFCGEPIPYRTSVKGRVVTLGQFKELLTKKGSYRFYFKKVSDEFDCGVVYEEVREDDAILPIFEERIIGKVEKMD
ncbi:axin-1-like [Engraulis encrasicolus]|uniref:axin-1-like n=1 Tax=Engraulis encrasicolus TaxID=184585 RepID=UPI002FD011DD